jgi:hypothetical protein
MVSFSSGGHAASAAFTGLLMLRRLHSFCVRAFYRDGLFSFFVGLPDNACMMLSAL